MTPALWRMLQQRALVAGGDTLPEVVDQEVEYTPAKPLFQHKPQPIIGRDRYQALSGRKYGTFGEAYDENLRLLPREAWDKHAETLHSPGPTATPRSMPSGATARPPFLPQPPGAGNFPDNFVSSVPDAPIEQQGGGFWKFLADASGIPDQTLEQTPEEQQGRSETWRNIGGWMLEHPIATGAIIGTTVSAPYWMPKAYRAAKGMFGRQKPFAETTLEGFHSLVDGREQRRRAEAARMERDRWREFISRAEASRKARGADVIDAELVDEPSPQPAAPREPQTDFFTRLKQQGQQPGRSPVDAVLGPPVEATGFDLQQAAAENMANRMRQKIADQGIEQKIAAALAKQPGPQPPQPSAVMPAQQPVKMVPPWSATTPLDIYGQRQGTNAAEDFLRPKVEPEVEPTPDTGIKTPEKPVPVPNEPTLGGMSDWEIRQLSKTRLGNLVWQPVPDTEVRGIVENVVAGRPIKDVLSELIDSGKVTDPNERNLLERVRSGKYTPDEYRQGTGIVERLLRGDEGGVGSSVEPLRVDPARSSDPNFGRVLPSSGVVAGQPAAATGAVSGDASLRAQRQAELSAMPDAEFDALWADTGIKSKHLFKKRASKEAAILKLQFGSMGAEANIRPPSGEALEPFRGLVRRTDADVRLMDELLKADPVDWRSKTPAELAAEVIRRERAGEPLPHGLNQALLKDMPERGEEHTPYAVRQEQLSYPNDLEFVREKLRQHYTKTKTTLRAIAESSGLPIGTIEKVFYGRSSSIQPKVRDKLAAYLNLGELANRSDVLREKFIKWIGNRTQNSVADSLGVGKRYLSNLLSGAKNFGPEITQRVEGLMAGTGISRPATPGKAQPGLFEPRDAGAMRARRLLTPMESPEFIDWFAGGELHQPPGAKQFASNAPPGFRPPSGGGGRSGDDELARRNKLVLPNVAEQQRELMNRGEELPDSDTEFDKMREKAKQKFPAKPQAPPIAKKITDLDISGEGDLANPPPHELLPPPDEDLRKAAAIRAVEASDMPQHLKDKSLRILGKEPGATPAPPANAGFGPPYWRHTLKDRLLDIFDILTGGGTGMPRWTPIRPTVPQPNKPGNKPGSGLLDMPPGGLPDIGDGPGVPLNQVRLPGQGRSTSIPKAAFDAVKAGGRLDAAGLFADILPAALQAGQQGAEFLGGMHEDLKRTMPGYSQAIGSTLDDAARAGQFVGKNVLQPVANAFRGYVADPVNELMNSPGKSLKNIKRAFSPSVQAPANIFAPPKPTKEARFQAEQMARIRENKEYDYQQRAAARRQKDEQKQRNEFYELWRSGFQNGKKRFEYSEENFQRWLKGLPPSN